MLLERFRFGFTLIGIIGALITVSLLFQQNQQQARQLLVEALLQEQMRVQATQSAKEISLHQEQIRVQATQSAMQNNQQQLISRLATTEFQASTSSGVILTATPASVVLYVPTPTPTDSENDGTTTLPPTPGGSNGTIPLPHDVREIIIQFADIQETTVTSLERTATAAISTAYRQATATVLHARQQATVSILRANHRATLSVLEANHKETIEALTNTGTPTRVRTVTPALSPTPTQVENSPLSNRVNARTIARQEDTPVSGIPFQATSMPTDTPTTTVEATSTQTVTSTSTIVPVNQVAQGGSIIDSVSTTGWVAILTALVSLASFISATLLNWRKETREAREAELGAEKAKIEMEKVKLEVEKIKTRESIDDDGLSTQDDEASFTRV